LTFVVNESCIRCKIMDCVEVCPVDCFYEGENMLVIHPEECIDCGVCVPECPAEAIFPDTDEIAEQRWLDLNRKMAEQWPNVMSKGAPPPDADRWNGVANKVAEHFSEKPGVASEDSIADETLGVG
jgi:ferredoxin